MHMKEDEPYFAPGPGCGQVLGFEGQESYSLWGKGRNFLFAVEGKEQVAGRRREGREEQEGESQRDGVRLGWMKLQGGENTAL